MHKLELLSAWAAIHSADPTEGPEGRVARRIGDVLRQVGGEGTPCVQDFSLGEIALARGAGVTATTHMLADVLDLEHRLPLTWAVARRGECEVWVARRVARLSRHLPADKVHVVDSAVSRMIASEAVGRVLEVAEAKVIEADAELHEERREAERRSRYVGLGRTDEFGLRTLIARLESGDAAAVDAIIHRVGEIIAPRHPDAGHDELRALAFGWLARPAELFALLVEHLESLRDQVHLVTGGDYWPYATSTSRSVDLDHPIPYDHGDDGRDPPPDQTGSHNSGPLGRRHHRWKTFAGYQARQCGEGRYVWLTPHDLAFLVDHTGTRPIHPEKARMILDAPLGVDLYVD